MTYTDYTYIKASKLGIGTSSYGSKTSKSTALKILTRLDEQGVNYIDTAISYGLGYSESIIGEFTRKSRHRFFISTKVGIQAQKISSLKKILLPVVRVVYNLSFLNKAVKKQSSAVYEDELMTFEALHSSIEQSLQNLKTDYIDQLLIHTNFSTYLKNPAVVDLLNQYKEKNVIRNTGITIDNLNSNTRADIQQHKALINTIQLPFLLEGQLDTPSVFVNYFSIFNQENPKTAAELKEICAKHKKGHFIVLMNSEKRIDHNINIFS